jgi:DNA-directed RNA polymerase subunit RPC12/RpoP
MEYYCKDCGDDFVTDEEVVVCSQCLSANIIKTED